MTRAGGARSMVRLLVADRAEEFPFHANAAQQHGNSVLGIFIYQTVEPDSKDLVDLFKVLLTVAIIAGSKRMCAEMFARRLT